MSKVGLIIKREYSTRVRKKSFLIMSIIGPILIAALFIIPIWLAQMEDDELKTIAVIDNSYVLKNEYIEDSVNRSLGNHVDTAKYITYEFLDANTVDEGQRIFKEKDYYAFLFIPAKLLKAASIELYSDNNITMDVKMHINNRLTKEIEHQILLQKNINPDTLNSVKTHLSIKTIKWTEGGEEIEEFLEVKMVLSFVAGFLIYIFVFMYGAQVMRGVIEEKTSRIVEVIVSSVKPFQLMMGKIIGVALVGLTQFLLWVILSTVLISALQSAFIEKPALPQQQMISQSIIDQGAGNDIMPTNNEDMEKLTDKIENMILSVDWILMVITFIVYFMGGYLLYASLFAAIGSAVDNDADTQQFMLPITIPLVLSIIMIQSVINNPDGPIAFWFSIIPFTSPIIMMARIPFGVEYWELALSIALLILTFIGTTWMAGKIYRTGILMYGKKVNYRELLKWLRYRS